jgi:hypothetical protein
MSITVSNQQNPDCRNFIDNFNNDLPRVDGHAEELYYVKRRCLWGRRKKSGISVVNSKEMQ